MNILYGVNATGNGHISRSRITISELKKRGHNVTVLFSGRNAEDFFDLDEFKPFIIKKGFTFVFKNGKLNVIRTLLNVDLIQFITDILTIKKEYDLIIDTSFNKVTIAKNSTGDPSNFNMIANVNIKLNHEGIQETLFFTENLKIKSKDNSFEQKEYENLVKSDFAKKIKDKLITKIQILK